MPTDTAVNDFIWFERDRIYEHLGLTENGELPEDEEPEEEMVEILNESINRLIDSDDFEEFCDDCDGCICNEICSTIHDCKATFEVFKNQVITIDEIKETWEEKTGMNIWR